MFSGVYFKTFAGIILIAQLVFGLRPDIIFFNSCELVGLILYIVNLKLLKEGNTFVIMRSYK